MYSYKDRIRAVKLYIKYDMSIAAVRRELGYPSRGMLYNWYREFKEHGTLHNNLGHSKYTQDQRKKPLILLKAQKKHFQDNQCPGLSQADSITVVGKKRFTEY